ncbi:hypothetical protein [Burkholderia plantarii]|uniref:hypothetical protein n=1 Tax=Burkholderia plantarii TaxID=41899 RepID=UPI000B33A90D|nr:hypothetical protein [Burkholderia plantarii]
MPSQVNRHSTASLAAAVTDDVASPTPAPENLASRGRTTSERPAALDALPTRSPRRAQSAPPVMAHGADLEIALPALEAHGEPIRPGDGASPPSRGVKALRMIDATSLLALRKTQDDQQFIAQLRDPSSEGANLPRLLRNLDAIEARLARLESVPGRDGLPAEIVAGMRSKLVGARAALQELNSTRSLGTRAAFVAGNLALGVVPFIVPLIGSPRQQQFAAELFALSTKTVLESIGMLRTPTAGKGLMIDRAMARNYANVMQACEFVLPTFLKPSKHLSSNLGVDGAAALVSTAMLFLGFLPKESRQKLSQWFRKSPEPELKAAGEKMSSTMHDALAEVRKLVLAETDALRDTRDAFTAGDVKALSPLVSKQVQLALGAYGALAEDAMHTLGESDGGGSNPDRKAKAALAVFTGLVTGTTAALMIPDMIGVVDLGSDAVFTTALMSSFVGDPNMSRKDSLDEFKTFAGLSVVMLAMLTANKFADGFMEKGVSGLLIGSLTLMAMNATLPGLVGDASARGLEAGMHRLSQLDSTQMKEVLSGIGNTLYQAFLHQARATVPGAARIDEQPPGDVEMGDVAPAPNAPR